ncbi:ribosome recycling factor [Algiphilus aromaticivorans]|jgi:ribosome recycling factor|uniref:ribosome recycling factor n=1 Tax=Algiphilus aromaticivorans TaxID=382454 RepID=UPI0005C22F45|nr:ribosome recycling factor [Algiphilus aromaticivorans]
MIEEIKKDASHRMDRAIQVLEAEYAKLRTGRATASLLDHVRVEYYGAELPVSQAANVTVEDARTICITAWEKSMVSVIEKAIMNSDLGLNPNTAGTVIRIVLPPLTEERRKDLAKVVRHEAENARVAVRNVRRDANQSLKDLVKEKEISDDDEKRGETEVQKITDQHIARIEEVMAAKEKEILSV